MSNSILFENVSKKFRVLGWTYTLREEISSLFKRLVGKGRSRDLWALRDVSFSIEKGDSVGIIGPNGAGKTTILRLISRITTPTKGSILVDGRVTSLIEAYSGLHQELSGRENIYLYGSILGLSRRELKKKFDQIVEFSGLADFLDTPIKQYSMGMTMRLGFSTIIHTDPDILLIDEVIVVGDISFMEKAFAKITELKKKGVTIILVTQIMDIMRNMVSKIIYLKDGVIRYFGDPDNAINMYVSERRSSPMSSFVDLTNEQSPVKIKSIQVVNQDGKTTQEVISGGYAKLLIDYESLKEGVSPVFEVKLISSQNETLSVFNNKSDGLVIKESRGVASVTFPGVALLPNHYKLEVSVFDPNCLLKYGYCSMPVQVVGESKSTGIVLLPHKWEA